MPEGFDAPNDVTHGSVALSHHWLVRHRGGERVLRALRELFPKAPVHTLVHDPDYTDSADFRLGPDDRAPVRPSFLQRIPGAIRHYPKLLPLMPIAARRVKLPPVDLVVCSDAALAKAMTPHASSTLVCYCHSPMRYAYDPQIARAYRSTLPVALRGLWGATLVFVRTVDLAAARRVDHFIANSQHVADRIRRCYGRQSTVVHPPVELASAPAAEGSRADFYLCVGQHVPYKRLDLAVAACRALKRPLVVIGNGPDVTRLDTPENRHVRFLGWQPDDVVVDHFRRARGLLFPGEEDFGIVPVEAQSHGCPVIAYGVGGARETVLDGRTGVLFDKQAVDALTAAIERGEALRFDPQALHAHAEQFSHQRFVQQMRAVLARIANRREPAP